MTIPLPLPVPEERIRALIFDLDGTLLDTRELNRRALAEVFRPFGLVLEEVPHPPAGSAFVEWVGHLRRAGLLPDDVDDQDLLRRNEEQVVAVAGRVPVIAPVVRLAEWARERVPRLPAAVATGSSSVAATALLAGADLARLFDVVIARDHVRRGKPDPEAFRTAARILGVPPSGCVVLEDTDIGMEAARRAAMTPFDIRPFRADRIDASRPIPDPVPLPR